LEGDGCRVLDVRGDAPPGLERGTLLPLTREGDGRGEPIERAHLASLGVASSVAIPLELSNGSVAGVLAALSPAPSTYSSDHVITLGLAARVLAYEWESVASRAELRRLRHAATDGDRVDPQTGLATRASFMELLGREWRLAHRGTLSSAVLVVRVRVDAERGEQESARLLALKQAAETLATVARNTDHVGRIGEMTMAVVMVGSDAAAGTDALVRRYSEALDRVGRGRVDFHVDFGRAALGEAPSPEQAIEEAERSVTATVRSPQETSL
jgi:GGDEF domain-containing protein